MKKNIRFGILLRTLMLLFLASFVASVGSNHIAQASTPLRQSLNFETQSITDAETLADILITDAGFSQPALIVSPGTVVFWTNLTDHTQYIEGTGPDPVTNIPNIQPQHFDDPEPDPDSDEDPGSGDPNVKPTPSSIYLPLIFKGDNEIQANTLSNSQLTGQDSTWQSSEILPGDIFSLNFDQPGQYAYKLAGSPQITGLIIVQPPSDSISSMAITSADEVTALTNASTIYVSSTSSGHAGGVSFADEDILAYDTDTGTWSMFFDGSDVGISHKDVDAFFITDDGDILLSVQDHNPYVPGVGWFDDSDIIRFSPSSTGPDTSGDWSMFLDGSDVGLSSNGEDIDAIGFILDDDDDDGDNPLIVVSTLGSFNANGASGKDEDLFVLKDASFGPHTSGTWEKYFDGSNVGLTDYKEDIWGIWIDSATGEIYLTTKSYFSVDGASGDAADIFICAPGSLGNHTSCTFSPFWDGSANGFGGETVDGIALDPGEVQTADLVITKNDDPDPVIAGTQLTYTLTISNYGPSDATGVTVIDTLPDGVTFDASNSSVGCSVEDDIVTCQVDGLAAEESTSVAIAVTVHSSTSGTLSNTASVVGYETDPNLANNMAFQETGVNTEADLALTKSASSNPVVAGELLTYTLTVSNNGPSDAGGIVVTDTLPADVEFDSARSDSDCSEAGGTVTCTVNTLAADSMVQRTLVVTVDASTEALTLTNQAEAIGSQTDPINENNSTSLDTSVVILADLEITKNANPAPAVAGEPLTYTLTISNNGPSDASGIVVTDTLPVDVIFNSVSPSSNCSETDGTVICTVDSLLADSAVQYTLLVTVDASTEALTLTNQAEVIASQTDPISANNSISIDTSAVILADLRITKSANPAPAVAGESLTYTLTISNNGPSDASGIVVTDTLPADISFNSALSSSDCNEGGGTVTCTVDSLVAGSTVQHTLLVTVDASTEALALTNQAEVIASQTDPISSNNTTSIDTSVTTQADLEITKSDSPDLVFAGNPLTYTIAVTNYGPSDAGNVVVTDTLPTGVTFNTAGSSSNCSELLADTIICTTAVLPATSPNNTVTATIVVTVDLSTDGLLSNTAQVDANQSDPDSGNNEDSEDTTTLSAFIVKNTDDAGPGSLRQTILNANANPGPDTITFEIPGGGPYTINPATVLPTISDPVIISGTSQTGASCDTPLIELDGTGLDADGLNISAGSSIVDGLIITGFGGDGIELSTNGNNRVECNTITANDGNGVHVSSGDGNTISNNRIFDNTLLGIDLGGDGVTVNDTNDPDTGSNQLQNFPTLWSAVAETNTVSVTGRINSTPDTEYTLEFFSNTTCDPPDFGEGEMLLGSLDVTTDEDGDNLFATIIPVTFPQDHRYVSATATDPNGNTSEFARCITLPDNIAWTTAEKLSYTINEVNGFPNAAADHYLDRVGQSRWYRMSVEPNTTLIVTLTGLGNDGNFALPGNFNLSMHSNVLKAHEALINDNQTTELDLLHLGANIAPANYSPANYSPANYSPANYSPANYSPANYSPANYSPANYSPANYSPANYSPANYSPANYSPANYSPANYSPANYSPDVYFPANYSPANYSPANYSPANYSPANYSPANYSPANYSAAQTISLIGHSDFPGTAGEGLTIRTWNKADEIYVRVSSNTEANLHVPFHLDVTLVPGSCEGYMDALANNPLPNSGLHTATGSTYQTIILYDSSRMPDTPVAELTQLATRSDVNGVLVDVSTDARVAAANNLADTRLDQGGSFDGFNCPYAKNVVAQEIKRIINDYMAINNPLEYVVIAGSDNIIPDYRYPDNTTLGNENNYEPPVLDATASQASLRLSYILTQDNYGSLVDVARQSDNFPTPGLAVGRLVETRDEMISMINAFIDTNGLVEPQNALATGYDFLQDAADAVTAELTAGLPLGATVDTLITPNGVSPQDPLSWTGDDLRQVLLGESHDLIFLAGHFSAISTLAADYETGLLTTDLTESTVDLRNAIVFSAGCHSGYNIVNEHSIENITFNPDWTQAFAQKGATLIAGSGYQYGDTDFIEYSERLYLEFSKQLRSDQEIEIPVGKALMRAKRAYLANTPQMLPLHEKSVLEASLFGLPMLKINMGGQRISTNEPSNVTVTPVSAQPGATFGLKTATFTVNPDLQAHTVTLTDTDKLLAGDPDPTVEAFYLSGSGSQELVVTNSDEPALPLEIYNVEVTDTVLRGVGFRGGHFTDLANNIPLSGAPTTELRGAHIPFLTPVFYPVQPWQVNYLDALNGGDTRLLVTPAQFQSTAPDFDTGTFRRYDDITFSLFYIDSTNIDSFDGRNPTLAAPPTISSVSATSGLNSVSFNVNVTGYPATGIHHAWVTYLDTSSISGEWKSLDLDQNNSDTTLWEGTLSLASGTDPCAIRYIVQAVNGTGLVSMDTNLGAYYTGCEIAPTQLAEFTSFNIDPGPYPYGTEMALSANLEDSATNTGLANQIVIFGLGSQLRLAVTDGNGQATASLPAFQLPGQYAVTAFFPGTSEYQSTSAQGPDIRIVKQDTILTLEPDFVIGLPDDEKLLTATLKTADGRPLIERTVFFVVEDEEGIVTDSKPVITDYLGRAVLGNVSLPFGTYSVKVYFNGTIPLKDINGTVTVVELEDDLYNPAFTEAAGSLVLSAGAPVIYVSSTSSGQAGGVSFDDEDILAYDTESGTWSMFFDGSDVDISHKDVDAFFIADDGNIYLSVSDYKPYLPEIGWFDDSDVLRFTPSSTGPDTSGSWSMFFDGSDVGLSSSDEDVDAIGFTPDGRLVVSTIGSFYVSGASGKDEDLIVLNNAGFGPQTSGTWARYFDGSDVGLTNYKEDIRGTWIDPDTGEIYLTTKSYFSVNGASGDAADIFICAPNSLDPDPTSCTFSSFWDGSANGYAGEAIDGLSIGQ